MLECGADVNAAVENYKNHNGLTVLMLAAMSGSCDTIDQLLKYGANLDDVTQDGKTALTIAIEKGNLQMTTLLLDNRTGINAGMDGSCTSLIQAALHKNQEIARLFTIMAHIPHFPCPGTVAASSEGLSLNNFHISRSAARFP